MNTNVQPVAWQIYWGIGEMRAMWPPHQTKEAAEAHAAMIKSNTEVRPLYLASESVGLTKDELVDLICEHTTAVYHCTRVWSAWNVGTMDQDDFESYPDSDSPHELADAILARINPVVGNNDSADPFAEVTATGQAVIAKLLSIIRNTNVDTFNAVTEGAAYKQAYADISDALSHSEYSATQAPSTDQIIAHVERVVQNTLPNWHQCHAKSKLGSLTAVEQFIFDHEPPSDNEAAFREGLQAVIAEVGRAKHLQLTEAQRIHIDQASTMLDQYAEWHYSHGSDSTAEGAVSSAYILRQMIDQSGSSNPATVKADVESMLDKADNKEEPAAPVPLKYLTAYQLKSAFRRGHTFVLHYHDQPLRTVTSMELNGNERVAWVDVCAGRMFPVKIKADGSCFDAPGKIWIEQIS